MVGCQKAVIMGSEPAINAYVETTMKTQKMIMVALLYTLTACGGGSNGGAPASAQPVYTASVGPQLRPCEATGPTAPPCPASN